MVSEITAEAQGVQWFAKGKQGAVVIHSRRTAIILTSEWREAWEQQGMRREWGERTTAVKVGDLRLVACYQPTTTASPEEIEAYWLAWR